MISASKTLKKNLSIAVATVFLAVAAFACWAIEPSKAYANTTDSHLTVASEVHVLVDSEGNVTIPNATVTNDGTCAAYIMGCSSPDGLSWTCDAVGKRIEVGQSITATWRSAGPVSDEIAAQLGEEPYYAGNLTYTYTDGDLKGTVSLDNTDPTVGDTITATVTGANVPEDKLTYQWVKVKDGSETSIDGATGSTYTATDDDAGYELVCKVSSTDDICLGTICGATGAVKKIQAFAVYSADDGSLSFYKRAEVPKQGTMYLGKRATAVYTGLENMTSIPGWMLNYSKDIKTAIVYDEGISPIDTGFWFAELRNMKTADVSKLDMSKCKTIGCMFTNCTSLTTLDLSAWDTRSLTDMNQAFQNCTSLTKLNVSGWDVSKVTNMTLSFAEDRTLSSLDLSTWDNSAVTSMKDVFSMMDSLSEVSLGSKFKFVGTSPFLPDQTGHVAGADGKWYDTDGNGYAPADIPSNKAMTYYASKDLLPKAFAVYSYDDQSLSFYKRSAVPAAGEQFNGKTATAVYTGIEDTNGSKPRWSVYIGRIKAATVVDNGIRPKSTAYWFDGCNLMTQCDMSKLETSDLTDASHMFYRCDSLTTLGDLSGWNVSKVIDMRNMFCSCSKLTTLGDLSGWNVSKVTNTGSMFNDCKSLTSVGDLSGWDVSKVTDMGSMFDNCYKLTTIGDLSGWDVSKVTYASYMFQDCYKLTTLGDLSGWNTSSLTNASSMFSYCSRLSVNCSNWDVSKVTNHSNFNTNAPGVILPSAWQTSSDEGVEDSTIAPLCEEQGNGDALSVPSENGNDEATSKTDGKASADSEAEGSNTASATDEAGAKEEEAPGGIVREEPAAA